MRAISLWATRNKSQDGAAILILILRRISLWAPVLVHCYAAFVHSAFYLTMTVFSYALSSFTCFGLPCFLFLKSASYLGVFMHSRNDLLHILGLCSLACLCQSVHLLHFNLLLLLHFCLWICSVPVLVCTWFDIF